MKVLHLAAGNRWTGAAAPAFAEVEALREAGVDAHYAYVGGYKLQAKIGHYDFAHPIIAKAQNPIAFVRSTAAIDALLRNHGFDVVHAHLTHDHWLAPRARSTRRTARNRGRRDLGRLSRGRSRRALSRRRRPPLHGARLGRGAPRRPRGHVVRDDPRPLSDRRHVDDPGRPGAGADGT